jgi:hypothetical protein
LQFDVYKGRDWSPTFNPPETIGCQLILADKLNYQASAACQCWNGDYIPSKTKSNSK